MTESKIDELLEKLEKLDPETVKEYNRQLVVVYTYGEFVRIGSETTQGRYILQCVIQDAVNAKEGWDWTIWRNGARAMIWVPWNAPLGPGIKGCGDSPAEAILAAYVRALEAEAAR